MTGKWLSCSPVLSPGIPKPGVPRFPPCLRHLLESYLFDSKPSQELRVISGLVFASQFRTVISTPNKVFFRMIRNLLYCCVFFGFLVDSASADWLRFRGPNGTGIAQSDTPSQFGENENLKWKLKLPGRGVSSPIVVGDKVFVTCYSGYGMGNNEGKIEDLKRHLVCVDRISGKTLWAKSVNATMPEDSYRPPGVTTHGYASHTPVSDGKSVFAFFGKSGVHAFDLEGNGLWSQSVGNEPSNKGFGSAASPIVSDKHVIVNAADESLSMVWLDKATGEVVHKVEAGALGECWSTPALMGTGDKTEVVISVIGEIWGMNESTGKLRWYANGVNARNAQVSILAGDNGIVYATGEEAYAVKVGGKGDVSETNTLWEGSVRTRYATPVLHEGHLFSISGPVVECINSSDGTRVFQERLPSSASNTGSASSDNQAQQGRGQGGFGGRGGGGGGSDFASPVLAGGKIYFTMGSGLVHVISADPEFKHIAANDLSFDKSGFGGTPAISDGQIFLRSNTHLYCVGE